MKTSQNIYHGDFLERSHTLPDKSVDLVFADPPFNIGYQYDSISDKMPKKDYLKWTYDWVNECHRIIKPNGSIFVVIGDDYAAELKIILSKFFHMRNWIIWHYEFGVYCNAKFGRNHTHILYFVKNPKNFTFNKNSILIKSKRQLFYSDKRANKDGRVPGDVWSIPRVCGTFKKRVQHPCQMPIEILERIIKVASNEKDTVLDPFCGSGTTLVACKHLNRNGIGFEISENYVKIIKRRIQRGF